MTAIFEHFHTVCDDEIDGLAHANNLAYLAWMQAAALAHSAAQGWPAEAYHKLGFGWVVRSHQITYHFPALAGDSVLVETWVASMRKVSSLRRFRIVRASDRKLLATAETDWAFINFSTRLPARIPPEVSGAFEVIHDAPS